MLRCLAFSTVLSLAYSAALHARTPLPGHAELRWISASRSCPPGGSVDTAVRMRIDPGWHTYWLHPGEAGMPVEFSWTLPDGWSAEPVGHPVPERFVSAGLTGFGYSRVVCFPVRLTAPREFTGEARLEANVTWLACGDAGCVPGERLLPLALTAGEPSATPEAAEIDAARRTIPTPAKGVTLEVVMEGEEALRLTLTTADPALDPTGAAVFPLTPKLIDPSAEIRFSGKDGRWSARVPLCDYFAPPLRECTLVIAGRPRPWLVGWQAPPPPAKSNSTSGSSSAK